MRDAIHQHFHVGAVAGDANGLREPGDRSLGRRDSPRQMPRLDPLAGPWSALCRHVEDIPLIDRATLPEASSGDTEGHIERDEGLPNTRGSVEHRESPGRHHRLDQPDRGWHRQEFRG